VSGIDNKQKASFRIGNWQAHRQLTRRVFTVYSQKLTWTGWYFSLSRNCFGEYIRRKSAHKEFQGNKSLQIGIRTGPGHIRNNEEFSKRRNLFIDRPNPKGVTECLCKLSRSLQKETISSTFCFQGFR